jgi:hypothetical protein
VHVDSDDSVAFADGIVRHIPKGLTNTQIDHTEKEDANLSPNQSAQYISIKNAKHIKQIEIIDSSGKTIYLDENTTKDINLPQLEDGVYLFEITLKDNRLIERTMIFTKYVLDSSHKCNL